MISGVVTDSLDAVIPITVQGPSGAVRTIEAVTDTGFGGFLTLPPSLIADLSLPFVGLGTATLGDGSEVSFPFHDVVVLLGGEQRPGFADAAHTTPLVGMRLLEGHDLHIEVIDDGQLTIERRD